MQVTLINDELLVLEDDPESGIKAGMEYEGRLRKYNKNNSGELVDCDMYSILKEDLGKN